MSLIYMNGFEWGSQYENFLSHEVDSSRIILSSTDPRSGDYCLKIDNWVGFGSFVRMFLDNEESDLFLQFALKVSKVNQHEDAILEFLDSSGSEVICSLTFSGYDNRIRLYLGDTETLVVTSNSYLYTGLWYLVEVHLTVGEDGTYALRINGSNEGDYNGDTGTSSVKMLKFVSPDGQGPDFYLDDVVVHNSSGDVNNSWPDGVKVILLKPHGKGSSTEWNKTAGLDNYECVDQYPVVEPENFIYTDGNLKLDLYAHENLPDDAFEVFAVRVDAWAMKNSGSCHVLNLAVHPATTVFVSTGKAVGASYLLVSELYELNPSTATFWTVMDVNEMEAGVRSQIP